MNSVSNSRGLSSPIYSGNSSPARQHSSDEPPARCAELRAFFETAAIPLHWVGPEGTILWANKAELDLLGYSQDEYIGRKISDFHVDHILASEILQRLARGEPLEQRKAQLRCRDGAIKTVLIDSSAFWENGRFVLSQCFSRDITGRELAEQRLALQYSVAEALAQAGPVSEAAVKTLRIIGENSGWDVGVLWILDREIKQLRCLEYWNAPAVKFPNFEALCRKLTFDEGVGLIGRVWACRRPAWIPDLRNDGNFPRASAAESDGLRAACAFPIFLEEEIVAVLELFSREVRPENDEFVKIISAVGAQIAQYLLRKRAEEGLLASERRMQQMMSLMPIGVYTCDASGCINFFNRRAAELWGAEPSPGETEEAFWRKLQLWRVDGTRVLPHETPMAQSMLLGRSVRDEELVIVRGNGEKMVISIEIEPLLDLTGHRFGSISVFQDITKQARADYMSRLLAAIVESSDDAIVSKDLNGVITSWNRGAQRLFGYETHEIVGRSVTVLLPPERLDEEATILDRIRHGLRIDHFETLRRRKNGELIHVSLTVSPVRDQKGRIVGASKIARDISDRKRAEKALHDAKEELARANAELEMRVQERTAKLRETINDLEAFSYTVSHDLRAPLRAIQGYAAAIREEHATSLAPDAIQMLERVSRSAIRLDRLIQDVLTYSRFVRSDFDIGPVDLDMLFHETVANYPEWRSPRVEIKIRDKLPRVLGNEPLLSQCITNLIGNAAKFVAPGTTPRIEIWHEAAGSNVRVCFRDNGIGIDPKDHRRIFGLFERIYSPKEFDGTGIGLSIVRKAVERMGGSIGVDSALGQGSTFWIELPPGDLTGR